MLHTYHFSCPEYIIGQTRTSKRIWCPLPLSLPDDLSEAQTRRAVPRRIAQPFRTADSAHREKYQTIREHDDIEHDGRHLASSEAEGGSQTSTCKSCQSSLARLAKKASRRACTNEYD